MSRASALRRAVPALLLLLVALPVLRLAAAARLEPADLAFNNGSEIATLDPATITGVPEGRVVRALFEGLYVKHPRTLEPLPGMATSHELSEDGRTYTFQLREGARWSNGDPVTAHDFVFSWERLLNPETAAEYAYQLWYAKGAREYSRLPSDVIWGDSPLAGWAQDRGAGRWRVGLGGRLVADADPAWGVDVAVAIGDELDEGDTLVDFPQWHAHVALSGRVVAINDALPETAADLLEDPYEVGWIAELELDEQDQAELARRLSAGELLRADDFRELFWETQVGIRARSDLVLEVELEAPTPFFLQLAAFYPLFPVNRRNLESARAEFPDTWQLEWLRPERLVTNGPYRIIERRINDRIRLAKSESYWDADSVALETIDVLAVENYSTMLNMYLTGEVAWIDRVSPLQVHRLLPREDFSPVPYLGSYFYRFNLTRPPFDDPRVRRALALAVDRRAICEKILKAGQQPAWSLVPPGMTGYTPSVMRHAPVGADLVDYDRAFAADVAEARALLSEAGFGEAGSDPLPFEIHYNTSEAHRDIAEVIAADWKRLLGLEARLLNQEFKVYLDTQRSGNYDVSRSAWTGDYLDPNTFLDIFVTAGENNRTGWSNAQYDDLIRRAGAELDPAERMELLARAEAILLEELPVLPINYYVTQSMFNPRLGGFYDNILDEHFPKHWYWRSDAELAERRASAPPGTELVPAPGPAEGQVARNHVPGRWD